MNCETLKVRVIACALDRGLDWMLMAWQICGGKLEAEDSKHFTTISAHPHKRLWPAVLEFLFSEKY
jgi:hypothetical protein